MNSNEFLKVNITDINWDIDEGEEKPDYLDSDITFTFKINDINECVEVVDGNFKVNDELLSEFLGDYISDTNGFCHNGFNYTYEFVK